MSVRYEWDVEVVLEYADTDDECILEHHHASRVAEVLPILSPPVPDADTQSSIITRLVLVRDKLDADGWTADRTWAYVENDQLPEIFDDGTKVPRKFHLELLEALSHD